MSSFRFACLYLFLTLPGAVLVQTTATIRGRVATSDGNPAEAVTIHLKGRGQGALTDDRGDYVLNRVKAGTYTVQVSAVG